MPRITAIETIRPAVQTNLLFVVVTLDDGTTGLGEAFFGARAVEAYVHETVAPVLLGSSDLGPESVHHRLRPYLGYQGAGAEVRGNGAIDLAMWDLLGKSTGRPIVDLLGGPVRPAIRIYNTCAGADYVRTTSRQSSDNWGLPAASDAGPWEDLDAFLHRPAALARELLAEGIPGMKIWPFDRAAEATNGNAIGGRELRDALDTVAAIREEVGTEIDLMIELHGLWNESSARRILRELAPFEPFWVEDPVRADTVGALRRLSADTQIPIAAGESVVGRRGFSPLLEGGAIDVATVDVQWSGGLTEARKVASLADAHGVAVAPHDCTGPATLAACAHLVMSQPNGLIQETVRAFLRTWYDELVTGLPPIEGGELRLHATPGHGVALRPDYPERLLSRTLSAL